MAGTTIGTAYVQILPSAQGIQNNLMKAFGGAENTGVGVGNKLGGGIAKGLKVVGAAAGAAIAAGAGAVVAIGKQALSNYKDYEQLAGGAQLMFGEAYDTVSKYAATAYDRVQMSQNDYLRQVNGFATGLKTSLNGDSQAAAELADKIVKAEADIVAATGNTQEAVQNAFNGIMRGNFVMLDNLQLGIKPTKAGMQEVIDKVNEWNKAQGKATQYQMDNLADMQAALVDYVEMVGISGYAQMEASKTIEGSLAMLSMLSRSGYESEYNYFIDDKWEMAEIVDEASLIQLQERLAGITPYPDEHRMVDHDINEKGKAMICFTSCTGQMTAQLTELMENFEGTLVVVKESGLGAVRSDMWTVSREFEFEKLT